MGHQGRPHGQRYVGQGRLSPTDAIAVSSAAAEYLFSHFPGLEDKISLKDYLEERGHLQDELFRKVPPMRGAVALVQGLVSTTASTLWLSARTCRDDAHTILISARGRYPHRTRNGLEQPQLHS